VEDIGWRGEEVKEGRRELKGMKEVYRGEGRTRKKGWFGGSEEERRTKCWGGGGVARRMGRG
jgi:hypothetical protein